MAEQEIWKIEEAGSGSRQCPGLLLIMQKEPGELSRALSGSRVDCLPAATLVNQTQTIAPVAFEQTLADCEWVAVAVQLSGGPATLTATTVTFCDGLNP